VQPKFPPWQHVYPRGDHSLEFEIQIAEGLRELRRLRKAGDSVILSGVRLLPAEPPSRDVIRFRASKIEGPRTIEDAPAPWDTDAPAWSGEIGFQADYLIEALQAAKHSGLLLKQAYRRSVTMKVWSAQDPALLTWEGGDAVIMPFRI